MLGVGSKGTVSKMLDSMRRTDTANKAQLNLDGLLRTMQVGQFTVRQRKMVEILNSFTLQTAIGSLIFFNMVLLIIETNTISAEGYVPTWIVIGNRLLLGIYVFELVARLFAFRDLFFTSPFNVVDLTVVIVDLCLEAYTLATETVVPSLTALRVLRLARLTRAYRIMNMVPMLSGMVRDLVGALEAVIWGCLLLGVFMTLWSVLAVQLIQPVVDELVKETSVFDDCERCPRAFSTVWQANLTLFQAIVAGDSWGLLALPVIDHAWWTSFFFVGTVFTLNLAVMNVILAQVVEKADETRKNDLREIMKVKEEQFHAKSKKLLKVCQDLDEDGSGDLTLDELLQGFVTNADFAATFHEMGIDADDMKTVFTIMDSDRSGTIDYREFVQHIYKMKTSDEITLLNFIRHYVCDILKAVKESQSDDPSKCKKIAPLEEGKLCDNPSHSVGSGSSLFLERSRVRTANQGSIKEVKATEVCMKSCHDVEDKEKSQRECIAAVEQMSNDLSRVVSDMASKSDAHLKFLQSIDKSMAALVANRGGARTASLELESMLQLSGVPDFEKRLVHLTPQRQRVASANSRTTGMCCSIEQGRKDHAFLLTP